MFPWAREEVACSAYTAARLLAQVNYLQNKSVGTKEEKPQSKVRSKEMVSIGKEQGQGDDATDWNRVVARCRWKMFGFFFTNSIYIRDPKMGWSLLYLNRMVPITEKEKNVSDRTECTEREECKVSGGAPLQESKPQLCHVLICGPGHLHSLWLSFSICKMEMI